MFLRLSKHDDMLHCRWSLRVPSCIYTEEKLKASGNERKRCICSRSSHIANSEGTYETHIMVMQSPSRIPERKVCSRHLRIEAVAYGNK